MPNRFIKLYETGRRFVIFDVETVGHWDCPTIVEIGAVEGGRDYATQYRSFQKILRFCPPSWHPYRRELLIHQIPTAEIENGVDREAVFQEFLQFIEGAVLICHTSFDIRVIRKNLADHQKLDHALALPAWEEFVDSCLLAKKICPHLASFALANLADHFQVHNPQAHRALADALTTKQIVAKLLQWHYAHRLENEE